MSTVGLRFMVRLELGLGSKRRERGQREEGIPLRLDGESMGDRDRSPSPSSIL